MTQSNLKRPTRLPDVVNDPDRVIVHGPGASRFAAKLRERCLEPVLVSDNTERLSVAVIFSADGVTGFVTRGAPFHGRTILTLPDAPPFDEDHNPVFVTGPGAEPFARRLRERTIVVTKSVSSLNRTAAPLIVSIDGVVGFVLRGKFWGEAASVIDLDFIDNLER